MFTITAPLAARASASTLPSRGAGAPGPRGGPGGGWGLRVDLAEPRVERLGLERGQRDDLGGHAQCGRASEMGDALLLLGGAALGCRFRPPGGEVQAGDEVQEVLP